MFLLFLQSEGGETLWIWLIVILLPMLGRVAGWVLERVGGGRSPEEKKARTQKRRERTQELERRGQEMWKRLLEGEESAEAPPEAPAAPRRPAPAQPRPATVVPQEAAGAPTAPVQAPRTGRTSRTPIAREGLPSQKGPAPGQGRASGHRGPGREMPEIDPLLQHTKSSRQAERDLRADEEPSELARVQGLKSLGKRREPDARARREPIELPACPEDWRRAVIWSEILRPPVSLRDPEAEDLPALR